MHSQMNLSAAQFRILVIFYSLGDTILVVPGSLTADSKQEAWIPAILGVGVGVFLVWMYIKLSSLYPNKTLIELNEAILGKWLGKFISLLFVASTLLFCSQVLFYVGSFLTTRIIIQTPMLAVHILFMGIVIVGVRLGILVLGNTYTRIALYPSYELARRIEVADFLKNIEVIMAIMWFLSLYFKNVSLLLCDRFWTRSNS